METKFIKVASSDGKNWCLNVSQISSVNTDSIGRTVFHMVGSDIHITTNLKFDTVLAMLGVD